MTAAMIGIGIRAGGDIARIAIFAIAYAALISLSILWSRFGGGLALIWPGTAILVALLLGLPRQRWPGVLALFAGISAAATCLFGIGPYAALPLAVINSLEGWVIASLLLTLRPQRDWLENVDGLAVLVMVAGLVVPALASLPAGAVFAAQVGGDWLAHTLDWAPAHGLGTLLAFPLVAMAGGTIRQAEEIRQSGQAHKSRHRPLAFLMHGAGIAAAAALAFFEHRYPLLFLPIAPLMYASLRLGRRGASLGAIVIAIAAGVATQSESGVFARLDLPPDETALFVQFYLATLLMLALPTSVARKQHRVLVAELEERKALKLLIADHSDDALLNLDQDGLVRYASPAGERLSGEDELVGRPLGVFFDPLDEGMVRASLAQAAASPGETFLLERAVIRNEDQLWLEAKLRAVAYDGVIHGYAVTIRDITARKQTELEAIEAAETDALTGLPNRRALIDQLERGLTHAEQRPFALAILDLDHFKRINDTHGHPTGDAVLRAVAAVMRRASTPSRYFARLGGEEFALISRLGGLEPSIALCEQLREEIAALAIPCHDRPPLRVTVSIGVAQIARRIHPSDALQTADALLYKAKDGGRNRVVSAGHAPTKARQAA